MRSSLRAIYCVAFIIELFYPFLLHFISEDIFSVHFVGLLSKQNIYTNQKNLFVILFVEIDAVSVYGLHQNRNKKEKHTHTLTMIEREKKHTHIKVILSTIIEYSASAATATAHHSQLIRTEKRMNEPHSRILNVNRNQINYYHKYY